MNSATRGAALLLLAAVLSYGCVKEKKSGGPVTAVNRVGAVSLNVPGNDLPLNALLGPGDRVLTGENSMVTLLFPEQSAVKVYENSEFIISKIGPAGTAGADDTEFAVEKGRAMLLISKLAKPDSLRVRTPTAVASVRGTTFVVSVDRSGKTSAGAATGVTVLRGTVQVTAGSRPQAGGLVREGETLEVSRGTYEAAIKTIPEQAMEELKQEEAALEKTIGATGGAVAGAGQGPAAAEKRAAEQAAPVLKTEKAIKEYYNKLEEVSLDDGTVLVGAVIYQDTSVARIHTPHGIIQVPTRSIKTIRMR